jgi:hypothetical protein
MVSPFPTTDNFRRVNLVSRGSKDSKHGSFSKVRANKVSRANKASRGSKVSRDSWTRRHGLRKASRQRHPKPDAAGAVGAALSPVEPVGAGEGVEMSAPELPPE